MRVPLVIITLVAAAAVLIAGGPGEQTAALLIGLVLLATSAWMSGLPIVEKASGPSAVALWIFVASWMGVAGFPLSKLLHPGAPLRTLSLSEEGAEVDLGKLPAGRYLLVTQVPRETLTSDMRYAVSLRNAGGWKDFSGEFMRTAFRARAGRKRTGKTESIHSADYHDVVLDGGPVIVRLDSLGGTGKALGVELHGHAASHGIWLGLQVALLLIAAAIDGLLTDDQRKSSLATGAAFTLALVEGTRASIRPDHLWRPLLGSAAAAILGGMAVGWLLDVIARRVVRALRGPPAAAPIP